MSARLSILFLALGSTAAYAGSADHKASGKYADVSAVAADGVASFYVTWWDGSRSDYHLTNEWLQCKNCDPELMLEVISEQILENWEGFYVGEDISVGSEDAPWGFGDDGDPDNGTQEDPMADFAGSAMIDFLSAGTAGTNAEGEGETCFNGLNAGAFVDSVSGSIESSQKISVGDQVTVPGVDGGSTNVSKEKDGDDIVTELRNYDDSGLYTGGGKHTEHADGSTSYETYDAFGEVVTEGSKKTESTPDGYGGQDVTETTTTTDYRTGVEFKGKETFTKNKDGSISNYNAEGRITQSNGDYVDYKEDPDGEVVTETGNDNDDVDGVQTTTEDESAPGMGFCIPDWQIAQMINWNMIGDAVTDPSPIDDEEDPDSAWSGEDISPIDPLEEEDVDLTADMMMPNESLWVTYPVPFLKKAGY